MRNKLLTLLIATVLTGSFLVGCGGNETGADVNNGGTNTEANVNTEAESNDEATQFDLSKYEETDYYYMVKDEADIDRTYVDGTEMDLTDMENFNYIAITIKDSLNMYNNEKGIVGYTKPNIECLYFAANDEWSMIAFSTEPVTSEGYPNGAAIVRTDELKAAMEVIDGNDSSAIGNKDTDSVETEVTIEEMYAFTKEICDEAGLVYDESAFADVSLEDIRDIKTSREYAHDVITIPIDKLDEKDSVKQDIVEYLKNNSPAISTRDGYNGIYYMIESVGIREPKYGEGSSNQYEFYLYLKFY